jgi:hypothetical protein
MRLRSGEAGELRSGKRAFFRLAHGLPSALQPLFPEGIKTHLVCNPVFEEFLTTFGATAARLDSRIGGCARDDDRFALRYRSLRALFRIHPGGERGRADENDALRKRVETRRRPRERLRASRCWPCTCRCTLENAPTLSRSTKIRTARRVAFRANRRPLLLAKTAAKFRLAADCKSASVKCASSTSPFPIRAGRRLRDRLLARMDGDPCSQKRKRLCAARASTCSCRMRHGMKP